VDEMTGETVVVNASSTVIATGGDANLFKLNRSSMYHGGTDIPWATSGGRAIKSGVQTNILGPCIRPKHAIRALPPNVKLVNLKGEEFLRITYPKEFLCRNASSKTIA